MCLFDLYLIFYSAFFSNTLHIAVNLPSMLNAQYIQLEGKMYHGNEAIQICPTALYKYVFQEMCVSDMKWDQSSNKNTNPARLFSAKTVKKLVEIFYLQQ